jgi:thiamine biosynthesis lipoprotein
MSPEDRRRSHWPSRRDVVGLGIGAFLVAVTPGWLRRPRAVVRRSVPVMGTIAELAVVHRQPRYAHAAIAAAVEALRRVDRTMTRFAATSDVGRANLTALRSPVPVSVETAYVLREALRWAEASAGAFDPCLARAVELWNVGGRSAPPSPEQVQAWKGRRLYRALELAPRDDAATVRFHHASAGIDLGGIAKGYAVDRAADALRAYGVSDALLGVGGDLVALGRSEDGDPWQVGIRSPDHPDRIAETIEVTDRAVATSGDYFQYFTHHGRRYHHLLDPATGEPRRSAVRSVTVVAETCLAADAGATAVFGLERPAAERILRVCAPHAHVVSTIAEPERLDEILTG